MICIVNQDDNKNPQPIVSIGNILLFLIPRIPTYKLNNPFTVNRMMPGIRKLLNGEDSRNAIGICIDAPVGSKIKPPPPKIAETPLKNNNTMATIRIDFSIIQI